MIHRLDIIDKKVNAIIPLCIFIIFVFTRLYRLDMLPFTAEGMHFDEVSAAYDAWCIQGWGVDRHLIRFPVYFLNQGEGQNALYIYLAALLFKLFGFSLFKFRLVAVICATFAFICIFFISKSLIANDVFLFIPNILMAIMPVFMMSEHWGLESYLFLSFSIISFFFLIKAIEGDSKLSWFISGGVFGITFYTYGVSYIVIPLFLLLVLAYLLYLKKVRLGEIISVSLPIVIIVFPLVVEQLVTAGLLKPFSLKYMDFFPMNEYRIGEVSFRNIWQNITTTPFILFIKDKTVYNGCPYYGMVYYISLPFLLIGIVLCVKKALLSIKFRTYDPYVLVILLYFANRVVILMIYDVNINKANAIYFPFLIFISLGMQYVLRKVNYRRIAGAVIFLAYFISFAMFSKWMFTQGENSWNNLTKPRESEPIIVPLQAAEAAAEIKREYDDKNIQMIINTNGQDSHNYLAICLFTGTSPYDYNSKELIGNGFVIGVPDKLDVSGDTVYLIEDELHHITDYLVSEGFTNQVSEHGKYSIVAK